MSTTIIEDQSKFFFGGNYIAWPSPQPNGQDYKRFELSGGIDYIKDLIPRENISS
ncbi:hypothetical protein FM107_18840 [Sphingobacterium sp. JB170]|nr:hypothetical protein FM107_18840 [Sphingobacterium sp. JB170]